MSKNSYAIVMLFAVAIAGCGTMNSALNESTKAVEYYRVFDIQTTQSRSTVIDAARRGLSRNAVNIQDARPIPPATKPAQPGRFTVVNPFAGTGMGAFAGAVGGQAFKVAQCDGAVWIGSATRSIGDSSARLYLCIWEYTNGYHLDVYSNYTKREGGFGLKQAAGAIAGSIVGSFEEALEKTVNDTAREIQTATGGSVRFVEGYPDPIGEPWWAAQGQIAPAQSSYQMQPPAAPVAPAPMALAPGQTVTVRAVSGIRLYPGGTSNPEVLPSGSVLTLVSRSLNGGVQWWNVTSAGKTGWVVESDLLQ